MRIVDRTVKDGPSTAPAARMDGKRGAYFGRGVVGRGLGEFGRGVFARGVRGVVRMSVRDGEGMGGRWVGRRGVYVTSLVVGIGPPLKEETTEMAATDGLSVVTEGTMEIVRGDETWTVKERWIRRFWPPDSL